MSAALLLAAAGLVACGDQGEDTNSSGSGGGMSVTVVARVGTEDVACPPSYSDEIARLCPKGQMELVPGMGHAQLIEQPDATALAIRAALG